MHFSYNRLWKMLIDRGMKKQELQKMSGVSAASIAKMGRCENVTTDVLLRICGALNCDVEDIMEIVPGEPGPDLASASNDVIPRSIKE